EPAGGILLWLAERHSGPSVPAGSFRRSAREDLQWRHLHRFSRHLSDQRELPARAPRREVYLQERPFHRHPGREGRARNQARRFQRKHQHSESRGTQMKKLYIVLSVCSIIAAAGQTSTGDRVAVPLTDPSRPVSLRASLINGGITVKGYEGKDVIVEARSRSGASSPAEGMRRITISSTGLSVEEENNTVKVGADSHSRSIDLSIQVPR